MSRYTQTFRIFAAAILLLGVSSPVIAASLCSDMGVFPVALSAFTSCTSSGGGPAGNDKIGNVQAELDSALEPDIVLDSMGSFCPGGGCAGSEFAGSDAGDGFLISPSSVGGSDSFTFNAIPAGTLFISLKQGNGFEVFKVPGPTPFDLTHSQGGGSTSHISTFAAVPEPTTLSLILFAGAFALVGRRTTRRPSKR